jgi:predicted RNase H-like nuclease (RuvC/YqgF family)
MPNRRKYIIYALFIPAGAAVWMVTFRIGLWLQQSTQDDRGSILALGIAASSLVVTLGQFIIRKANQDADYQKAYLKVSQADRGKMERQEVQIEKLESQIVKLQSENHALEIKYEEKDAEVMMVNTRLVSLQSESMLDKELIRSLNSRVGELTVMVEGLKRRISAYEEGKSGD